MYKTCVYTVTHPHRCKHMEMYTHTHKTDEKHLSISRPWFILIPLIISSSCTYREESD